MVVKQGLLLRIFIEENDKYEGAPLYEWIVHKALKNGLADATVVRGIKGLELHREMHTAKVLRLSSEQPIVVEMVDTSEKIEAFLPIIEQAISGGVATLQDADIRRCRD